MIVPVIILDLHSNMVKFKWKTDKPLNTFEQIYIPIWLNSNGKRFEYTDDILDIYIPIWLNSNVK